MMPEPIIQRLVHRIAPASNSVYEVPLGPFPLSFLTIDVIRVQPTAGGELSISELFGFINRVHVHVRGISVFDGNGFDAFVIGSTLYPKKPAIRKASLSATTSRVIGSIFVPFSRRPLMPLSGLPALGRGEGILRLEFGSVPANTLVSIHAVGWRENKPEWLVRCVRNTINVGATGDFDAPLAIAGSILGFIFHETNPMLSAATAITDNIRLLIGGVEDTLMSVNLEGLLALEALTSEDNSDQVEHQHTENTASAYAQNAVTRTPHGVDAINSYTTVMLDELYDPDAIVAVPPGADVRLRITASATGTLYVFPIELFVLPERPPART